MQLWERVPRRAVTGLNPEARMTIVALPVVALAACVGFATAARAGPFGTTADYRYGGLFSDFNGHNVPIVGGDAASSLGFQDFLAVAVSNESKFDGPQGTVAQATANAFASAGRLGASIAAEADAVQARSQVDLRVRAEATLFDVLTMSGPAGSFGQVRHLTNSMTLTGGLRDQLLYAIPKVFPPLGDDYMSAGATSDLEIFGTGVIPGPHGQQFAFKADSVSPERVVQIENAAPQTVTFSMDFVVGTPTAVFWNMQIAGDVLVTDFDSRTHFPGSASLVADFSHTLAWGTDTTITDPATGAIVTDATITSASGFDYLAGGGPAAAVPEPSSAALLGSGIVALALAGVERRRRRASYSKQKPPAAVA
jgi:hypothetical protein